MKKQEYECPPLRSIFRRVDLFDLAKKTGRRRRLGDVEISLLLAQKGTEVASLIL